MYSGIITLHSARLKPISFRHVGMGGRFFIGSKEWIKFGNRKALAVHRDRSGVLQECDLGEGDLVYLWNYNHQKVLIKGFRT